MGFDGGLGSVDVHAQEDWHPVKKKAISAGLVPTKKLTIIDVTTAKPMCPYTRLIAVLSSPTDLYVVDNITFLRVSIYNFLPQP